VLPDGEEGELVFTTLSKEALPVIRYRTRDLTRLLPPTSRSMRRIGKITGRSDDMLIIRGVNVFPTQIEELLLKCPELTMHYLIEVTRESALDQVAVGVELCVEAADLSAERQQEVSRTLQHLVKTCVGISVKVLLHKPNTLERSAGKARHVIDSRPKESAATPQAATL
jgi:phenylacetate-CoA ligase